MAKETSVNVYGINLTLEERIEWNKREETTWIEYEIPEALEEHLSKVIEKEIKKYHKNKQ